LLQDCTTTQDEHHKKTPNADQFLHDLSRPTRHPRQSTHTIYIYPATICCSSSTRTTDQTLFASSDLQAYDSTAVALDRQILISTVFVMRVFLLRELRKEHGLAKDQLV
jgi:hypothetical protein